MKILTTLLILFISISAYANNIKADQQHKLNSNLLDIDKITLETFHAIKKSWESLEYPIDYSAKIICDDNFSSIVLTIHNKQNRHSIIRSVFILLKRLANEKSIHFDLYVEMIFKNTVYRSNKLFFISAFSNSCLVMHGVRAGIANAADYYQRDISPYYQQSNCSICGGGSTLTKYGKLSHKYGCRYTLHGIRNNTLKTKRTGANNISKYRTKTVSVRGYYRKDGTYVKPHKRRPPRRR